MLVGCILLTANHSLISSPLGNITADLIFPLPNVALAYSDNLCRLPLSGWDFNGLNVLFLLPLYHTTTHNHIKYNYTV